MTRKFLSYHELKAKGVPWSRVHIGRLEREGRFPKHVELATGTCLWLENEIDEFLDAKVAERELTAA